jgi:8-oxoguanine deaminase
VAALIFCGPVKTRHTIIHGKLVVEDGQLVSLDLPALLERHKQAALSLLAS